MKPENRWYPLCGHLPNVHQQNKPQPAKINTGGSYSISDCFGMYGGLWPGDGSIFCGIQFCPRDTPFYYYMCCDGLLAECCYYLRVWVMCFSAPKNSLRRFLRTFHDSYES
uniref:Uncharacterized protein n=1 Tax=Parascaris univalens TaxID=6257 RepID=A0A915AM97_PARUN